MFRTIPLRLALCFFVSGAAGLIYQLLWLRILALTFGVTSYAISTVLAGFMAGLGLGSLLAGRYADRIRHPMRAYAIIEALIGITGALTPFAFAAAQGLYRALHPHLESAPWILAGGRFVLAFLILLVPTSLMGATLPVVLRSPLVQGAGGERRDGSGASVSMLYAVNTAGAIVGCLATAFFLIGGIGIRNSVFLAAGLNLLAAIGAFFIREAGRVGEGANGGMGDPEPRTPTTHNSQLTTFPPAVRSAAFWVIGASGLVSLAYEVVWSRLLATLFDGTVYAFAVMLGTFLLGLATGSAAVKPLLTSTADRPGSRAPLALAAVEFGIGLACVFSLFFLTRYGWNPEPLFSWIPGIERFSSQEGLRGAALVSFVALLPATFLMGASFPLAVEIGTAGFRDIGRRVGNIYAMNVGGSIIGSLLAGFVLLPVLGVERSMHLLVASNALLGLWMLLAASLSRVPQGMPAPWIFVSVAAFVLLFVMTRSLPPLYGTLFASRFPGDKVLWRHEGLENTVTVAEQPGQRVLYLNGHHQANDSEPMVRYHRLIGHLPMVLHPKPKRVLIIGLGGGATAGAVARYAGASVDCIELSPGVVAAARYFTAANEDALSRPNMALRVDDGRNHLLLTKRKYDVIAADIIQPHHAGAGNLYSVEYYRLCKQALAPGGLMCQWLSKASPAQYRLMLRTFLAAFPYVSIWDEGGLAIGSNRPMTFSRETVALAIADPALRGSLGSAGLRSPGDLERLYAGTREQAVGFVGDGPILTDDRPRMEYFRSTPGIDDPAAGLKLQRQIDAAFPMAQRRWPAD